MEVLLLKKIIYIMITILVLIISYPNIAKNQIYQNTTVSTNKLFQKKINIIVDELEKIKKQTLYNFNIPLTEKEEIKLQNYINRYDSQEKLKEKIQKNEDLILYVRNKLKEADLPPDFVYIIAVESTFNNKLTYKNTHGLWQLWYPGFKRFGLKNFNDVFCPKKSTKYAILYLKHLFDKFNGNQRHVIYAYNVGETKIQSLVNKYNGEIPPNKLPKITRQYIPKMIAFKTIVESTLGSVPEKLEDSI